jgi:hypothetical protein
VRGQPAKVRSTAHRRGITANPRWSAGLHTMSSVVRSRSAPTPTAGRRSRRRRR